MDATIDRRLLPTCMYNHNAITVNVCPGIICTCDIIVWWIRGCTIYFLPIHVYFRAAKIMAHAPSTFAAWPLHLHDYPVYILAIHVRGLGLWRILHKKSKVRTCNFLRKLTKMCDGRNVPEIYFLPHGMHNEGAKAPLREYWRFWRLKVWGRNCRNFKRNLMSGHTMACLT